MAVEPRGSIAITTDAAALHARISNAGRLERVCLVDATSLPVRRAGARDDRERDTGALTWMCAWIDSAAPIVTTTRPGADVTYHPRDAV